MDADDLFKRDRSQGKGIPVPKIAGCREGEFRNVFKGLDMPGLDARLVESFLIKFRILVDMIDCPLEPFQLKPLQFPFRPNLWHESLSHGFPSWKISITKSQTPNKLQLSNFQITQTSLAHFIEVLAIEILVII